MDLNEVYLSVRQMAKIYPFISVTTIASWIANGILIPEIHVKPPAGPGQGSKLSFVDLVTVGILYDLFGAGVRFDHFKMGGHEIQASRVRFQTRPVPPRPDGTPQSPDVFQRTRDLVHLTPNTRTIQNYLIEHHFQVCVCVEFVRPLDLGLGDGKVYVRRGRIKRDEPEPATELFSTVIFFPSHQLPYYLSTVGESMPNERITFINVEYWKTVVEARLRTIF